MPSRLGNAILVLSVIAAVLWVWFNDTAGPGMPFTIAIGVLIVLIGIGLRYFIGSAVES
jgi:hypothetical protein